MPPDVDAAPITISEAVREAAGIVDPSDRYAPVGELERWFEDHDEPANTVPDLDRRLAGAVDEIDPDGDEPALAVAAAVALYLASLPRHAPREPEGVVDQALQLWFGDDVPEPVAAWLDAV